MLNDIVIDKRCHNIHEENSEHHTFGVCRVQHSDEDAENANKESVDPFSCWCLCC